MMDVTSLFESFQQTLVSFKIFKKQLVEESFFFFKQHKKNPILIFNSLFLFYHKLEGEGTQKFSPGTPSIPILSSRPQEEEVTETWLYPWGSLC